MLKIINEQGYASVSCQSNQKANPPKPKKQTTYDINEIEHRNVTNLEYIATCAYYNQEYDTCSFIDDKCSCNEYGECVLYKQKEKNKKISIALESY